MIEAKLALSRYVDWTFISCHTGWRKPELDAYEHAAEHLGVLPSACIFIDDRLPNVKAAAVAGMTAVHFRGAADLEQQLLALGIKL
eukprot:SM000089S23829  [mRNA]  locus=s89:227895:228411:- [translate_table: standard]